MPSNREAWLSLPEDARAAAIAEAEKDIGKPWPSLPATVFIEYKRIGNRSNYEAIRNQRRNRLSHMVLAECIENKGRFLEDIFNGIWLTCEETYWGLPAHLNLQKAGHGLPDVAEPSVDLFAAETSAQLAWADYLLAPQLAKISPMLRPRIHAEIRRRVLEPCMARTDWGWMGFRGGPVNNWNPWINSNWLTSVLLIESDEPRRAQAVHKILTSVDRFLDAYHPDGGCDEGPGYWGRAGASLFDNLELLHSASNGAIDFFAMPLVQEIGRYIYRAHIQDDYYVNFADASARLRPAAALIHRYGTRIKDRAMQEHAAFVESAKSDGRRGSDSLGRDVAAMFTLKDLRATTARAPLVRDAWMPGIQVMCARQTGGASRGFYFAAQGGHNAESHNHNDVGNFIVFLDGRPVLIDVGVETYSAKTFSSKRYEIWTMQSAYHNCPTVNGVMQAAGRQFAAKDVASHSSDRESTFTLDIAGAYPKEASLAKWHRTLRLNRTKNEIEVIDVYRVTTAQAAIDMTLMTLAEPRIEGGNRVRIGPAVVEFDERLKPQVEPIQITDGRLRGSWGDRVYRVLVKGAQLPAESTLRMRLIAT
ncbi:MAG: heparinase II/III family protein [Bryobacterales bacterium]|nr:heparinase II/III family protein [Bryobacterales bacterium]